MSNVIVALVGICFGICLQVATLQQASARTWSVERDGTGDYTVIQDAVDAAASGDTIMIGPGRFNEKHWVVTEGWSEFVRVQVTQQELTIIGSGQETIIGQDFPWNSSQGRHKGIATGDTWGNSVLRVGSLHMENMANAIYTSYEFNDKNVFHVSDCSFSGNDFSLYLIGNSGDVEVRDCSFNFMPESGVHVHGWNQNDLLIQGCDFRLVNEIYGQSALGLMGVQNALIEGCNFFEGTTGVTVTFGGPVQFRNCLFDGQGLVALYPSVNSSVAIDSCSFRNQVKAVESRESQNQVTITNSVVENVTDCSFSVWYTGGFTATNCDLAKGDRGVIWILDQPSCAHMGRIDLTNNYWGTDSPDSVRAWIHDRNDSEDACYYVDFEPFSDVPLPTEKKSLGSFKSLYR